MAVGKLVAKTDQQFQEEAFTKQFCLDKILHWAESLKQARVGFANTPTEAVCRQMIDQWLDELAGVAEIRWIPKTDEEKYLMNYGWRNGSE